MLQQQHNSVVENTQENKKTKLSSSSLPLSLSSHFSINDQPDILVEVLKRLDGRSLGVASCVCRLWHSISKSDDSVWEYLCFRHVSSPPPMSVRPLVRALGGYKRLYMVCVKPALRRVNHTNTNKLSISRKVWTRQGAQLLLSLFCVDYYEKLSPNNNNNNNNSNNSNSNSNNNSGTPSSLMFLCKPVNV